MYGRNGYFTAQPGKGQLLASLLLEAADVLGHDADCLLYLVSRSEQQPDVVWVYETWTNRDAHTASLHDERVTELVARARPLIAGMSEASEFIPVGGKGLD